MSMYSTQVQHISNVIYNISVSYKRPLVQLHLNKKKCILLVRNLYLPSKETQLQIHEN